MSIRVPPNLARPVVIAIAASVLCSSFADRAAAAVDFAKDIQPILRERCVECHGPAQQMNGLRLDRRRDVLPNRVGANGAPVVPGNSAASRVYRRISGTRAGQQMPPTGPLSAEQINTIKAWIDGGDASASVRLVSLSGEDHLRRASQSTIHRPGNGLRTRNGSRLRASRKELAHTPVDNRTARACKCRSRHRSPAGETDRSQIRDCHSQFAGRLRRSRRYRAGR